MDLEKKEESNINNEETNISNEVSKYIPINKFVILNIFTLGLYQIYWSYTTWKFIKEKRKLDISPILRTIFIPFFIGSLSRNILEMAKEKAYTKSYNSILIFILFWIFNVSTNRSEGIFSLGFLIVLTFVLIPIQKAANHFWEKELPNAPIKKKFSATEIFFVVLGGIIIFLAVIGSTIIPDTDKKQIQSETNNDSI